MNIKPDPIHRQKLYRPIPGVNPRMLITLILGVVACPIAGALLWLLGVGR